MHYIGIDSGGTKTAFTLFDEDLTRIDSLRLGTTHFQQAGYDGMERLLVQGISELARRNGVDEFGLGFGIAGFGEEAEVAERIREGVARVADGRPYTLVNDGEAALAASLALGDGIVLVSGTGSIAFGTCAGREGRCGGWGYQVGDEGSGWWIGKQMLAAFSRESDGRAPRGALHDIVMDELGLGEEFDIIGYARDVLTEDRTKIAALSRLVARAAEAGDAEATAIFEAAARELASLAVVLARDLFGREVGGGAGASGARAVGAVAADAAAAGTGVAGADEVSTVVRDASGEEPVTVTYAGGTYKVGELILEPLRAALPACCKLVEPVCDPDMGAVLLLRDQLE